MTVTPTDGSLRAVRLAQGKSLRDVAEAAGITPIALSRIERGLRQPMTGTLLRILAALELEKPRELLARFVIDGEEDGAGAD